MMNEQENDLTMVDTSNPVVVVGRLYEVRLKGQHKRNAGVLLVTSISYQTLPSGDPLPYPFRVKYISIKRNNSFEENFCDSDREGKNFYLNYSEMHQEQLIGQDNGKFLILKELES